MLKPWLLLGSSLLSKGRYFHGTKHVILSWYDWDLPPVAVGKPVGYQDTKINYLYLKTHYYVSRSAVKISPCADLF